MGLRWFANNLADTSVGQQDYIANSMVQYRFICEDIYNDEQYRLNLKIAPDPSAGDGSDYQHSIRW